MGAGWHRGATLAVAFAKVSNDKTNQNGKSSNARDGGSGNQPMPMTVSDLLLKVLAAHGVRYVFGIPGDAINDVMDALRRQDVIRFIGVRHEETGAFAAAAQAKLTGQLAACVGTAGPGAIHLLNGLYDAKLDHAPVIAITGQVETGFIGTEYHQEVRLERLFAEVAVYSQTVTTPAQVPAVFREACHAALANRGIAHISLPTDISGAKLPRSRKKEIMVAATGRQHPTVEDCQDAVALIKDAGKVAILAGIGCRDARDELISFAEQLKAPIVRTLKAKEIIDDNHPLCLGGLGMLGTRPSVSAMEDCDLLIMVGTDFPYHDFYPKGTPTIQIDIEPTRIGKRQPVEVALVGDAGPALKALSAQLDGERSPDFLRGLQKQMQHWLAQQAKLEESTATPLHPARVMAALGKVAPDNTIFVCDTGTVTAWSARHLRLREGQRYTLSGGLASMAYALPGAISAQLTYPDRTVIAMAGDGGFAMLMGDFVTAVKYELPIVVLVLNNHKLALITLEQRAKGLPDWGTDLLNPDFAAFAQACGGVGFTVKQPGELEPAISKALDSRVPAIIDIMVDPDALIMPPKVELAQAFGFALSRVREAFSQE